MLKNLFVIMTILTLNSIPAFADTNPTGVTDSLAAGMSEVMLAYSGASSSANVAWTISSTPFTGDFTSSSQIGMAGYLYGITDKANVGIFLPVLKSSSFQYNLSNGGSNFGISKNSSGMGDLEFGARYQFSDKKKDGLGWVAYALLKPATAPSDQGSAKYTGNYYVNTPGKDAQSGTSTVDYNFGTRVASAELSDMYLDFNYWVMGTFTYGGGATYYQPGNVTSLFWGIEKLLAEKLTFRPEVGLSSVGSSTNSLVKSTTNSYTNIGVDASLIYDISKNVSVLANGGYAIGGNETISYANGNSLSLSSITTYTYGVAVDFFF